MEGGGVLFVAWSGEGHKLSSEVQTTLHQCCVGVSRTSGLLYFFGAELGCGGGRGVMGGGVIPKQEVAPSEDGANALLRCFTHLETYEVSFNVSHVSFTVTLSESRPLVCCALWSWEGHDRPGEWKGRSRQMHPASSAAWRGTTGSGCAEKRLPTTAAVFLSETKAQGIMYSPIWEPRQTQLWPVWTWHPSEPEWCLRTLKWAPGQVPWKAQWATC